MRRNGLYSAAALATVLTFGLAANGQAQDTGTPGDAQAPAAHGHYSPGIYNEALAHGFGEFARGIEATGLRPVLEASAHTVFIADDAAFQVVSAEQREAWRADPAAERAMYGYAIVEGVITTEELRTRDHLVTIDGHHIPIVREGDDIWIGGARIVQGDLVAGQGMIHQVDAFPMPGEAGDHRDHQHRTTPTTPGQHEPHGTPRVPGG